MQSRADRSAEETLIDQPTHRDREVLADLFLRGRYDRPKPGAWWRRQFHFLTEDRSAGGHVLDLVLVRGELAIDATASFHLELPTDAAFLHADLGHDSRAALDRAERGK